MHTLHYNRRATCFIPGVWRRTFSSSSSSSSTSRRVRGMKDLWPATCRGHDWVEKVGRETVQRFGYKEIRTPIVERCATFERSLGVCSDVVNKEMFTLEPRGREDDKLCLRPEQTACIMRAVVESEAKATLPHLLYYHGPMFRYERPQRGRLRQFHQFGVECVGVKHVAADAEVIVMAIEFLKGLGLDVENLRLEVNTLGNSPSREAYSVALLEHLKRWVEEYPGGEEEALSHDSMLRMKENRPLRVLDSKHRRDQAAVAEAPMIHEFFDQDTMERFHTLCSYLDTSGVKYDINQRLVRGLDYYSDTIFEIIDRSGAEDKPLTLLAGGRYDGLATMMGSKNPIPAIGWAAGVERLVLGLNATSAAQHEETTPSVYLVPIVDTSEDAAAIQQHISEISAQIRSLGYTVIVGHDLGKPGVKSVVSKGIKAAQAHECSLLGIVGSTEVAQGTGAFVMKNLNTREQTSVTSTTLEATIEALIGIGDS